MRSTAAGLRENPADLAGAVERISSPASTGFPRSSGDDTRLEACGLKLLKIRAFLNTPVPTSDSGEREREKRKPADETAGAKSIAIYHHRRQRIECQRGVDEWVSAVELENERAQRVCFEKGYIDLAEADVVARIEIGRRARFLGADRDAVDGGSVR